MPTCRHETLQDAHDPTEMILLTDGRAWLCKECGATLLCPPEESAPTASPGLISELEAIVADKLERRD
jgi:hypothetical protein